MTRLLVDVMCGGIVTYLRMCGHDTVYALDRDVETDDAILDLAREEGRTILTRDVALAGRTDRSILLESRDTEAQLVALSAAGVDLELAAEPIYCSACNGPLDPVEADEPTPGYVPAVAEITVWRCRDCDQHFWRGSHWNRVRETLSRVRRAADR